MAQLQSTNVVGTLCVNGVAVGGGKDFKFCCFASSTTWSPPSGLVSGDGYVDSIIVGGGGGGSGQGGYPSFSASGGGGGGVATGAHIMTSTSACTITIGSGGARGTTSAGGAVGGDSCFAGCYGYGGGGADGTARATSGGKSGLCFGGAGGGAFGNAVTLNSQTMIDNTCSERQGGVGTLGSFSFPEGYHCAGPGMPIYKFGPGGGGAGYNNSKRSTPALGGSIGACAQCTRDAESGACVCGAGGAGGSCNGCGTPGTGGIIVLKWAE